MCSRNARLTRKINCQMDDQQQLRKKTPLDYDADINLQLLDSSDDDSVEIIANQRAAVAAVTVEAPTNNVSAKKGKNWCLTINCKDAEILTANPDQFICLQDEMAQFTVQKSACNYYVYGKEIGKKTGICLSYFSFCKIILSIRFLTFLFRNPSFTGFYFVQSR